MAQNPKVSEAQRIEQNVSPLSSGGASWSHFLRVRSSRMENGRRLSSSPSLLFSLFGLIVDAASGGVDCYVLLFDSTEPPAEGTVCDLSLRAFEGSNFDFDRSSSPWYFQKGCYVALSTDPHKYAAIAAVGSQAIARFHAQLRYEAPGA